MKVMRFFVTLVTVFAIGATAGCGKSESQEADDLIEEGNSKQRAAVAGKNDLYTTHDIELLIYLPVNWAKYNREQLVIIERKLLTVVQYANRVAEIRSHKNINPNTGSVMVPIYGKNAAKYLEDLRKYKPTIGMR